MTSVAMYKLPALLLCHRQDGKKAGGIEREEQKAREQSPLFMFSVFINHPDNQALLFLLPLLSRSLSTEQILM